MIEEVAHEVAASWLIDYRYRTTPAYPFTNEFSEVQFGIQVHLLIPRLITGVVTISRALRKQRRPRGCRLRSYHGPWSGTEPPPPQFCAKVVAASTCPTNSISSHPRLNPTRTDNPSLHWTLQMRGASHKYSLYCFANITNAKKLRLFQKLAVYLS